MNKASNVQSVQDIDFLAELDIQYNPVDIRFTERNQTILENFSDTKKPSLNGQFTAKNY